jgi:YD repeat-containing protein
VTRQAAQRTVEMVLRQLRPVPTPLAAVVREAWELAAAMAPTRWRRVRESLVQQRYIERIELAGLLALGAIADATPRLVIVGDYLVADNTPPPPVAQAIRLLRTKVRANGAWQLQEVIAELGLSGAWRLDDFALDVAEAGWTRLLCDDWVAEGSPQVGRDRLANLTRKVLAACGPVTVEALAAGLERQVRFGRLPTVPPAEVLTAYLANHLDFQVTDETVTSLRTLDPEQELSRTELVIWRRLREADGGSLTRDDLRSAARSAGVDVPAFASALSYSPLIESRAHGLWGLRGIGGSAAKKAGDDDGRVITSRQVASRTARAARYTWDDQGRLVITSILASPESTVVSIPRAVQVILEGREFVAVAEDGEPVGTVKVRGGRSWGYDRYLASRRGRRGDLLSVTFDLSRRISTLASTERRIADD